jgi:endonuclease YncB( thermonuclease family)
MLNPNKNDTDLPDQIYMAFKKQIKNAGNYAKKKKLGIWSKKKDTNNK